MTVEIVRTYGDTETLGDLTVYDGKEVVFQCKTLELPWKENKKKISCIPEGSYLVKKRESHSKRPYDHFHIQNVPNRDWILIHIGNLYTHIQGCILVGEKFGDINKDGVLDVLNSTSTLTMLYAIMPQAFVLTLKKKGAEAP